MTKTTMSCTRCAGTGFWAPYRTCWQCDGTGTMLTPAALKAARAAYAVKEAARLRSEAVASVVAAHTKITNGPARGWVRRLNERELDAAEAYALATLSGGAL